MRTPKHGHGRLKVAGTPGNRGGPGRPKLEFKEWCKSLLDDASNRVQVEQIMGNHTHPAYSTMFRVLADRAHGKPEQTIEHKGTLNLSIDI